MQITQEDYPMCWNCVFYCWTKGLTTCISKKRKPNAKLSTKAAKEPETDIIIKQDLIDKVLNEDMTEKLQATKRSVNNEMP